MLALHDARQRRHAGSVTILDTSTTPTGTLTLADRGHLDVGTVADREQMPDVARLVGPLADELAK